MRTRKQHASSADASVTVWDLVLFGQPQSTFDKRVLFERARLFFLYSLNNMLGVIVGAICIAVVLSLQGAELVAVGLWLAIVVAVASSMMVQAFLYPRTKQTLDCVWRKVVQRMAVGCVIAVFYGSAVWLLPPAASVVGSLQLLLIVGLICAVTVLQYAIIPTYYILFNLLAAIPFTSYLLYHNNLNTVIEAVLLLIALLVMIFKGLRVSKQSVDAIVLNLRLSDEIDGHVHTKSQLERMARVDHLTQVANRCMFEETLRREINLAERNQQPLSLLYIDLNDFKPVNDQYGHHIGDKLLKAVAVRMQQAVRGSDLVARIGGDEFAIIFPNCDIHNLQHPLVAKLTQALAPAETIDGVELLISASLGIARFPGDGQDQTALLRSADQRMYAHKQLSKAQNGD